MGIHQCGSESNWPFFDARSFENSFNKAESKEAVSEKDPKEVPTCLMLPSVFVICRAVAWSTFSTWQAAPFFATATRPYFSRPFAAHSEAEGMGASMHNISACALLASYS